MTQAGQLLHRLQHVHRHAGSAMRAVRACWLIFCGCCCLLLLPAAAAAAACCCCLLLTCALMLAGPYAAAGCDLNVQCKPPDLSCAQVYD
jgi:hypothetical protein